MAQRLERGLGRVQNRCSEQLRLAAGPAAGQAAVSRCVGRSPALGILGWRGSVLGAGGLAFGSADARQGGRLELWIPSLYMSYRSQAIVL